MIFKINFFKQEFIKLNREIFNMKTIILGLFVFCLFFNNSYSQNMKLKDTLEYRLPSEILITAPRFTMPLKENPAATSILFFSQMELTSPRLISTDEAL